MHMDLEYRGDHGEDCEIDLTVQNSGTVPITVSNVTVVLICPVVLGPTFSDPNVTYTVFIGEREILPGESYTFSDDGKMPNWDIPQLSVIAYVTMNQGNGAPQQFNVTSYASPLDASGGSILIGNVDWVWALVPFTFIFMMVGFWYSYYVDRPYWDLWVKDKIYDEKSNFIMRWRWLVYRWMDEGKGSYIIAIWVIISLTAALITYYVLCQMPL